MTQRWAWVTTGWKMASHCVETIFQEIQSFQPPADQRKQCHCTFYCATFFFFFTWLLILSFPALYALPASAIKGVHGGRWDVPGRGDQGDQSDQGPQAAPHAPVPRIDASRPSFPAAPLNPASGTRTKPELLASFWKKILVWFVQFCRKGLLAELDFFCLFRNGNHCCLHLHNMLA